MAGLPEPAPGLVIRYSYLWRREARRGLAEGAKDRPCVVVLAVQDSIGGRVVTVAPITHTPPLAPEDAVELPTTTKARLGLDDARSWILATEVNQFAWPGPDLRPAVAGRWAFGFIPGGLLRALRTRMATHRKLTVTSRDES